MWPPLPTALQDAPPLPSVGSQQAPSAAVAVAPVEPVLEAQGTAALVAEAAVLEAEGFTETAEVNGEAAAALRESAGTSDTDSMRTFAYRADEDEDDRFMPLDTGFDDVSPPGVDEVDDLGPVEDLDVEGDGDLDRGEPAWAAELVDGEPVAAGMAGAAVGEARLLDDALDEEFDRFMPLQTGFEGDLHRVEEPAGMGVAPTDRQPQRDDPVAVPVPEPAAEPAGTGGMAPVDLEALVLAEEAALEAERLEAERLELARLTDARSRAEETAGPEGDQAARQRERQDALARFAAQRDEAQRLLALQEERAARSEGADGEPRRPLMAGDFEEFAASEEDDIAARNLRTATTEPEALVAPDETLDEDEDEDDRLWPLGAADDFEPAAQLIEQDQLDAPILEPEVPDDAVADLDEDPPWGGAEPATGETEPDDELEDAVMVEGWRPAPAALLDEDEDEDEDDEGRDVGQPVDHLWPDDSAVMPDGVEDDEEEDVVAWPGVGALDVTADRQDDEDDEDTEDDEDVRRPVDHLWPDDSAVALDDVEDEEDVAAWPAADSIDDTEGADDTDDEDELVGAPVLEQDVAVDERIAAPAGEPPPPPAVGDEPDTWAAWVKANPTSWATWSDDDDGDLEEPAATRRLDDATAPADEDLDDLDELPVEVYEEPEPARSAAAVVEMAEEPEDDLLAAEGEQGDWVPVGEKLGERRRPLMTSDFDDALSEDLVDGDGDERVVPEVPARPLRRSGRPRVPLKARRRPPGEPDPLEGLTSPEPVEPAPPEAVAEEPLEAPESPTRVKPVKPVKKASTAKKAAAAKKVPKKVGTTSAPVKKAPVKKAPVKAPAKKATAKGAVVAAPAGATKAPRPRKVAGTTGAATRAGGAKPAAAKAAPAKRTASRKKPEVLWVEAIGGTCPPSHPVKASVSRGIFHVVGGLFYERSQPERCYRVAAAAEADGLRQAKR